MGGYHNCMIRRVALDPHDTESLCVAQLGDDMCLCVGSPASRSTHRAVDLTRVVDLRELLVDLRDRLRVARRVTA
jgi:hypothetical protein